MFLFTLFLISARYSAPLFYRTEHITYSLLISLSRSLSRQNTLLHKMTGWWLVLKKKKQKKPVSLISQVYSPLHIQLHFLWRIILAGFENSGIWPFWVNAFSVKDFKVASTLCGGSNKPRVLTAWSVGLTTPSMVQIGSSLEKKVTPEGARTYSMTAPSVSRNGGRLKGK